MKTMIPDNIITASKDWEVSEGLAPLLPQRSIMDMMYVKRLKRYWPLTNRNALGKKTPSQVNGPA